VFDASQGLRSLSYTHVAHLLILESKRFAGDLISARNRSLFISSHVMAHRTCARWLGFRPDELLMVACHNFDLNATREAGYRTAFIGRPAEWGPAGPRDPIPHPRRYS
jgi:2-haloacid dehalogenase